MRLQPYASHAIAFQGGKGFDKADRLFQSIERVSAILAFSSVAPSKHAYQCSAQSWVSASGGVSDFAALSENLQDVKELIPEFYYLPGICL